LFSFIFILAQNALRAGSDANPPLNMTQALIFNGAFVTAAGSLVFLIRGTQARRQMDEQRK